MSAPNSHEYSDRIVRVYGAIDEESALEVVEQLLCLAVCREPITMYISSPGGSVTSGFAILDAMQHVQPIIRTIGIGCVASMAAVLFACGEPGHRHLLPHARYMLHGLRGAASGRTPELESHSRMQREFEGIMENILMQVSRQPRAAVRRLLAQERFLSPGDAMALGLADHILLPAK